MSLDDLSLLHFSYIHLQRFLQLQYPVNSTEAEATGTEVSNLFLKHIKGMESETNFDLNE